MIRYFDLGVWTGREIDIMLNVLPHFGEFEIHGIEATKLSYSNMVDRYKNHKNIHLYNFAINSYEGNCRLYYSVKKANGNSIYDTKNNVNVENWEEVECMRFSKWLENFNNLDDTINIMKYNIEGAELDLFRDMDKENLFSKFNIIVGNSGGDIKKCAEIVDKLDEFYDICQRNNLPTDHRIDWKNKSIVETWRNKIEFCLR
jgi:FkbM family methyltransferase